MGHYTIRTNDEEDQVIRKAQEATGMASASKAFMTAILELQRNRDEIAQLWHSLAQEKSAVSGAGIIGESIPFQPEYDVRAGRQRQKLIPMSPRRFSLKNRDYHPSLELRFHVAHAVSDAKKPDW
ncbi:hypothetical protein [Erwinia tracheiphila]|uniref:hypothetical protein n=1 Tax=Erwinia tracheiphila TaxID=65700 RepID=UPI000B118167|nr:hypothetical protein [Erwinia tracheiphila]